MNRRWGQIKTARGLVNRGSGHGMAKVAGTHSLLSKAAAGEHSRRTIRPAQASKKQLLQTMKLAGLAAKH